MNTGHMSEEYLRLLAASDGGWLKLETLVKGLMLGMENARQVAEAVIRDAQPMKDRVRGLLEANNRLVDDKRALVEERDALRVLLAAPPAMVDPKVFASHDDLARMVAMDGIPPVAGSPRLVRRGDRLVKEVATNG